VFVFCVPVHPQVHVDVHVQEQVYVHVPVHVHVDGFDTASLIILLVRESASFSDPA
jgi:hypothetical protein